MRPDRVSASLRGRLNIVMSRVPRESEMTWRVGHLGDFERSLRRGIWSGTGHFQGGHVVAHEFGGPENWANLVPMLQAVNLQLYRDVERYLNRLLPIVSRYTAPEAMPVAIELDARMTYGDAVTGDVLRLVTIIARKFGGDREAERAFRSAMPPASARDSVGVPARTPTTIVLTARVLLESIALGTPPGAATESTGHSAATRDLDPIITAGAAAGAPPPAAPAPAAGAPGTPAAPPGLPTGPQELTWTFTQPNN
jgi:hypothetical protein